jgi:hypothetical protein
LDVFGLINMPARRSFSEEGSARFHDLMHERQLVLFE